MLDRRQTASIVRTLPLLALLGIAAVVSYRYHRLLIDQRDLVEHTYQVISTLEDTQLRIIDAETGQRGFVITGNDAYLVPYQRAVVQLPVLLVGLRRLVADSPLQSRRLSVVSAAVRTKLDELEGTVKVRRRAGLPAAQADVMRDRGRLAMDSIRLRIGEMRAAEAGLLARRIADAKRIEARLFATTVACFGLSLLARVGLALVQARHLPVRPVRRPRRPRGRRRPVSAQQIHRHRRHRDHAGADRRFVHRGEEWRVR